MKKPFDEKLMCPSGHVLRPKIIQGRRSCDCCIEVELKEGTGVYACFDCDWIMCRSCYRSVTPHPQSTSTSTSMTPKCQEMKVKSWSDNHVMIPVGKTIGSVSSEKKESVLPEHEERLGKETFASFKRIMNFFLSTSPHQQKSSNCEREVCNVGTPEQILSDPDTIRSVVKAVANIRSRSSSRRSSRSPSDYSSPRRRRYRWSDSLSLSGSDESEISPYRRRSHRRRRR